MNVIVIENEFQLQFFKLCSFEYFHSLSSSPKLLKSKLKRVYPFYQRNIQEPSSCGMILYPNK